MDLWNIHTHVCHGKNEIVSVIPNAWEQTRKLEAEKKQHPSSKCMGIHPWFIEQSKLDKELELLKTTIANNQIIAIGECGLDRSRIKKSSFSETGWQLQKDVFIKQIKIANWANLPMIIHCVKAFPELIELKKKFAAAATWVIHAFNGNKHTAGQLLKHHCRLSFGWQLLSSKNLQNIFSKLPPESIFLETDSNIDDTRKTNDIKEIFRFAAAQRNTSIDILDKQISLNVKKVFSI